MVPGGNYALPLTYFHHHHSSRQSGLWKAINNLGNLQLPKILHHVRWRAESKQQPPMPHQGHFSAAESRYTPERPSLHRRHQTGKPSGLRRQWHLSWDWKELGEERWKDLFLRELQVPGPCNGDACASKGAENGPGGWKMQRWCKIKLEKQRDPDHDWG